MISSLPAHIKHTLVFLSSSIVLTGLMVHFISSVGGMFWESSLTASMGFAKLTHLGFEMCYEDAYGQPLRFCLKQNSLNLNKKIMTHNLSLIFSFSLLLHNKLSLISFFSLPFLVFPACDIIIKFSLQYLTFTLLKNTIYSS